MATDPKEIRHSDSFEDVDLTSVEESISRSETFPVGVHTIELNQISIGQFLWINPTNDLQVNINGLGNFTIKGGKRTKLWASITSLAITVTTDPNYVSLVVAGA